MAAPKRRERPSNSVTRGWAPQASCPRDGGRGILHGKGSGAGACRHAGCVPPKQVACMPCPVNALPAWISPYGMQDPHQHGALQQCARRVDAAQRALHLRHVCGGRAASHTSMCAPRQAVPTAKRCAQQDRARRCCRADEGCCQIVYTHQGAARLALPALVLIHSAHLVRERPRLGQASTRGALGEAAAAAAAAAMQWHVALPCSAAPCNLLSLRQDRRLPRHRVAQSEHAGGPLVEG